jgi:spore coat polysaccharide biosynthesis protein SpsF
MKIGAIIQVRNNSIRLPGKVLMPLPFPDGDSLLFHILKKVKKSNFIDEIYLATTISSLDDEIERFGEENSVKVFRGSEEDVLSRFVSVVEIEGYDVVIRLTGDNPFIDVKSLDIAIDYHLNNENDYTKTEGLPLGMNFEIVRAKALLSLSNYDLTTSDREHVTFFFNRTNIFKKSVYKFNQYAGIEDLRLTVDYPSDYAMASLLFSIVEKSDLTWPDLIVKVKDEMPWVFNINHLNVQKQV